LKIKDTFFAHADNRGEIWDVLIDEEITSISLVTFKKGAIRGNHIHNHTAQWNYVHVGKLLVATKKDLQEEFTLDSGKVFLIEPGVAHAMMALEDCQLFVFTLGDRAGTRFEEDTFRLEIPLIK